jgi:hypothetical protein
MLSFKPSLSEPFLSDSFNLIVLKNEAKKDN